ncbi:hypothetical protein FRC09_004141 [Ceratobasidium sp. 395]|nr:hypothetical protein FRC09_004141 [Ceratobasidium sp. 395]
MLVAFGERDQYEFLDTMFLDNICAGKTAARREKDMGQEDGGHFEGHKLALKWSRIMRIYDHASQIPNAPHVDAAVLLGVVGLMFFSVGASIESEAAASVAGELMQTLLADQPEPTLSLDHAVPLAGVLRTLVQCKLSGRLHISGLIEQVWSSLDRMLPPTHIQRPVCHYLLGQALYTEQSNRLAHGSRAIDCTLAIEHYRRALELTPDWHRNQCLYLQGLVQALDLSTQSETMSPSQISLNQCDFVRWTAVLNGLAQELFDPANVIMHMSSDLLSQQMTSIPSQSVPDLQWFEYIENMTRAELRRPRSPAQYKKLLARHAGNIMVICTAYAKHFGFQPPLDIHIDKALNIWRYLQTFEIDTHLLEATLNVGLGETLVARAKLEISSGNIERAYSVFTEGIAYLERSCNIQEPSMASDIERIVKLADAYASRHRQIENALNIPDKRLEILEKLSKMESSSAEMEIMSTIRQTNNLQSPLNGMDDIQSAIDLLRRAYKAALSLRMPAGWLIDICERWVICAAVASHVPSLFESYQALIPSIAQLVWVGVSFRTRYDRLRDTPFKHRATQAAAVACCAEVPYQAILFLELGKAFLFAQALPLRNRYPRLRDSHPELVSELETLGHEIEVRSFADHSQIDTSGDQFADSASQVNRAAYELGCLGEQWDRVVSQVRTISSYEHFLQIPPLEELILAARYGFVVFIVTSPGFPCYAVALLGPSINCIRLVDLPVTQDVIEALTNRFHEALARKLQATRSYEPNDTRKLTQELLPPPSAENIAYEVLSQLWCLVMKPIIEAMTHHSDCQRNNSLPQVWLNVTGPLASLPLHAAGNYTVDGTTVASECRCFENHPQILLAAESMPSAEEKD